MKNLEEGITRGNDEGIHGGIENEVYEKISGTYMTEF